LFEGDGYNRNGKEAEKGFAKCKRNNAAGFKMRCPQKSQSIVCESQQVYNHLELEARHEIELEKYIKGSE